MKIIYTNMTLEGTPEELIHYQTLSNEITAEKSTSLEKETFPLNNENVTFLGRGKGGGAGAFSPIVVELSKEPGTLTVFGKGEPSNHNIHNHMTQTHFCTSEATFQPLDNQKTEE